MRLQPYTSMRTYAYMHMYTYMYQCEEHATHASAGVHGRGGA